MRVKLTIIVSLIAAIGLGVGMLPVLADHGLPHVVQLARGTFTDDVAAQVRVKLDGRQTQAINVKDASDAVVVQITIHDGAIAPWHTHPSPGLLVNAGPGTLTSFIGDDCVPREYGPGEALVDPGQGTLHAAFNDSGEDLVLYGFFVGVGNGFAVPADPPAGCDPFP